MNLFLLRVLLRLLRAINYYVSDKNLCGNKSEIFDVRIYALYILTIKFRRKYV
jgi:hypothetical protein